MVYHLVAHRRLLNEPPRFQRWQQALSRQGLSIEAVYDLSETDWPARLAQRFNLGDRVLALGGDGTHSSVAHQCVEHDWPLAVLPAGTANDFCRALGIPFDPDQACALLLDTPSQTDGSGSSVNAVQQAVLGKLQWIDVGRLNGRVFLNVAHIGIGAEVTWSLQSAHKSYWGGFSYLRRLLQLLSGKRRFSARIEADGVRFSGRWLEIAVANGPTFGGGHRIAGAGFDTAGFDTAALTLVAVRARPIPKVLLAWVMARLGYPLNRKLVRVESIRQCRISPRRHLKISADGERFGRTPAHYQIEPAALRVLVPAIAPS
ncbi:MAG: diacylglycerol kinase family protein [Motiliproteus sp.]